jgi:ribosomal protein L7/L12
MKNWYYVNPVKEESIGPISIGELLANSTLETLVWREESLKDWVAAKDHPELADFQEILQKNSEDSLNESPRETHPDVTSQQEKFNVIIKKELEHKLQAVEVLQNVFSYTLVEAAKLVETVPSVVKSGLSEQEASAICNQLNTEGVFVEMELANSFSLSDNNSQESVLVSTNTKDNFILELPTLGAFLGVVGWGKSELKYSIYQDGLYLTTLDAFNETDHLLELNINNSKTRLRIELIGIMRFKFFTQREYPFNYSQEIDFDQIIPSQVTKVILKTKSENLANFLIDLKTVEPKIEFVVFLRDNNYIEI